MGKRDNADGPIVRWLDYGPYEGWRPESYDEIQEALMDDNFGHKFTLMRPILFEIKEKD